MTGAPLPTTNKIGSITAKTVEEAISGSESAVETIAITAVPWLGLPVLKQLWEGLLDWIFKQLGNTLGLLAGYVVIDIEEYAALVRAARTLQQLDAARTTGDKGAIQKASDAADAAAASIIHYYGSIQR